MSILLRPNMSAGEAAFITACAAVAVAQAIESVSEQRAQIKWVNDIYIESKKVCGILTEAAMDMENNKLNFAVLGIGINLLDPQGDESLRNIAGGIFKTSIPDEARAKLCAQVLNSFMEYYRELEERRFMSQYRERSNIIGKQLTFIHGNEIFTGVAQDIDDNAALILRLNDGTVKSFTAGEISLHHFHKSI